MAYQRNMYTCNDFTNTAANQNQISYLNAQPKGNEYTNIPNQYSSSCPQLNINYQQQNLCINSNPQLQQKQQLHYKQPNAYNSLNRNGQSYVISNKITPSSTTSFPILSMSNQSSFGQARRQQIPPQSNIHPNNGFSTITPSPDQDTMMTLPVYNSNNPSNNNDMMMTSASLVQNMSCAMDSQHQHYMQKQMPPTQLHKKSKIHQQSTHHPSQMQQHKHQQQQTWGPFIVDDDNELVNVDEYAEDILEYLKNQELCTMPEANYMAYQNEITNDMRRILIEWLIEVHGEYDLKPETLYLTINLIDRYLSKRIVPKSDFQLLGVTALWVAAKYEEAHGKIPSLNQMKFICCKYYEEPEFIQMEMRLLEEMNFSIGHPTPEAFLKLQLLLANYERTVRPAIKYLARYIMETSLIDYNFIRFTPSVISQSSLILAVNILNQKSWTYVNDELWECIRALVEKMVDPPKSIYTKYSSNKYMRTSVIAKQLIMGNPKFKNLTQNFDSNSLSSMPFSTTSIQILTTTSNSIPVSENSDQKNSKSNKPLTTTFTIITTSTTSPRDSMSTDMDQYENEYGSNTSMPTPPKETVLSTPSMIVNNASIPTSNQAIPYTSSYSSMNNNQWISSVNNMINLGNLNGMNTMNSINTINNMNGMNTMNNMNNMNHRSQRNSLGRMGIMNTMRNVNMLTDSKCANNDTLMDDIKKMNIMNMNRMNTKNMNMDISEINLKQYPGKSSGKIYTMMNNNMNNKINSYNTNV
jgi:hypothetical protein